MGLTLEVLEVGDVGAHERSLLIASCACLGHGPCVVTAADLQLHRREADVGMLERKVLRPCGKALARPLQVPCRQVQ